MADRKNKIFGNAAFCVLWNDAGDKITVVKSGYSTRAWSLPGGGIEQGELPHLAVVREVREETGFEVLQLRLRAVLVQRKMEGLLLLFDGIAQGNVRASFDSEITAVEFVVPTIKNLMALPDGIYRAQLGALAHYLTKREHCPELIFDFLIPPFVFDPF